MAIVSVVKYEGDPDVFAWKYPDSELGTWTQLIVNESQQAILFKGGQALDVFEAGRHTLTTNNIPFLEGIINLPFGGQSPFSAEVWFVNKQFNLDVKWGTPSPIQIQDPVYGVFVPVRSHGVFGIRIDDAKKFLVKLVGTLPSFTKDDIMRYFRGVYVSKVKDAISTYIVERKVGILEINMYLDELSEFLRERIGPVLADYGVGLVNFYVNDISVPEDDSAVVSLKAALAKRAEMNVIGYNYVQERSFDTLEGAANNSGSAASDLMGAGLGLGMGLGMGGGFGGAFGDVAKNLNIGAGSDAGSGAAAPNSCTVSSGGADSPVAGAVAGMAAKAVADAASGERESEPSPSSTVASPRFCVECGSPLSSGAKFCAQCGTAVATVMAAGEPDNAEGRVDDGR